MAEPESEKKQSRTPEEIQADIAETRDRLADNIAQLKAETKPAAIADKAKATVTGVFVDHSTGAVRVERVAAVVGVVVGLIVIRRGLKSRAHRKEIERLREVVWVPVPRHGLKPEYTSIAREAKELTPPIAALTAG